MNLHHKTNVNEAHDESLTFGQRVADKVAGTMGSWKFIITQATIVTVWIIGNIWLLSRHPFDPYPFILLNLAMSAQASFATPLLMMSQNRQAAKDRIAAEVDYQVNRQAETHIEEILTHLGKQNEHLDEQDHQILAIAQRLDSQQKAAPTKK